MAWICSHRRRRTKYQKNQMRTKTPTAAHVYHGYEPTGPLGYGLLPLMSSSPSKFKKLDFDTRIGSRQRSAGLEPCMASVQLLGSGS